MCFLVLAKRAEQAMDVVPARRVLGMHQKLWRGQVIIQAELHQPFGAIHAGELVVDLAFLIQVMVKGDQLWQTPFLDGGHELFVRAHDHPTLSGAG